MIYQCCFLIGVWTLTLRNQSPELPVFAKQLCAHLSRNNVGSRKQYCVTLLALRKFHLFGCSSRDRTKLVANRISTKATTQTTYASKYINESRLVILFLWKFGSIDIR